MAVRTAGRGVGNWFTAADANYTQTQPDILDGIDAFTVSPRVGYRFTPGIDKMHLPSGKAKRLGRQVRISTRQEFSGSLDDLTMPPATLLCCRW